MILKKKTLKKNPSNRIPISYFTEFRLDINPNNFVRKLCPAMINAFQDIFCFTLHLGEGGEGRGKKGRRAKVLQTYRHTDRHTDPPTKRVLEEHSLLKSLFRHFVVFDIEGSQRR